MDIKFIPIDYDYFDFEDKNYIRLIGKSESGKKICVIDSFEANFWVILKDGVKKENVDLLIEKIGKINIKKGSRESCVLRTEVCKKKYLGRDVSAIKVYVTNHKDCSAITSEIGDSDDIMARREHDINIVTKYIMEGGIKPMKWHSVSGDILAEDDMGGIGGCLDVDLCLKISTKKEIDDTPFSPKVLAYDIETTSRELGKGKILMISLWGEDFHKVLTWQDCSKKQDFVECFSDEASMIEGFVDYVKKYSPDILCGYFSDGFDLPYLRERAKKKKVKLDLGIDGKEPRFSRGIIPTGKISGIVHIDLYRFIAAVYSQYLASETLSLNEVASELIGSGKEDFDFDLLNNMNDDHWYDFFSYSLKDSEVTYKLFGKVWPDILEFTKIIKEPCFNVSRDRMASHVENYLLHNLSRFDEIAEKNPVHSEILSRKAMDKFEGAFVYEPTPGLYEDIVMFDFTSMYGSVIVTYNLSKTTLVEGDLDSGYEFSSELGFFPTLLAEIIDLRKKYKKEYNLSKDNLSKARSNAYKLLANASYGYQGFYGARYYSREAASSTTRLAKENILLTIDKIKDAGFKVLYSDTDSIAFLRGKKSRDEIMKLLFDLNKNLPGIMELDLEDFFQRGIFVTKKGGKKNEASVGAKKKYALLQESGKLNIRGFETVRRDWCQLARRLQSNILKEILVEGNEKKALEVLREVVSNVRSREIDLRDIIIKTQLKKELNEYASKGPHVAAAIKMEKLKMPVSTGMIIEYYVGEGKGKKIGDRVLLPSEKGKYDIDYYLKNQIFPAVLNIFEVFGVNVEEALAKQKQMGLGDF
jgi:DNA polymerase elongation subunit (family B)